MGKVFVLILHICTCVFSTTISDAITWLEMQQRSDGCWSDSLVCDFHATWFSTAALAGYDQCDSTYLSAVSWLAAQKVSNLDFLARQMQILDAAGMPVGTMLAQLCAAQQSDGGFGMTDHYESNVLDAAIVLHVILGYASSQTIIAGIEYLKDEQNVDGGWGLRSGEESSIYITGAVLELFARCTEYDVAVSVTDGLNFVASAQHPDSGFGRDTSTVWETAQIGVALAALDELGDLYSNVASYLLTRQSVNGSWHDSPYVTALVLLALKASNADLAITSGGILFEPAQPLEGDTLLIKAVIQNVGSVAADQVLVEFYDGDPDSGGITIGEYTIPVLDPGAVDTVSTEYVTDGNAGRHFIHVLVDPYDNIFENSEENNHAVRMVRVIGGPDLELAPEDFTFYPQYPAPGQDLILSARILNAGQTTLDDIAVGFYDGHPDSGGVLIESLLIISSIPSMGYGYVELITTLTEGEHTVYGHVDPLNTIDEIDETNNSTCQAIQVYDWTDLAVYDWGFFISQPKVVDGDTVTIGISVFNERENIATSVRVRFHDGDPDSGGVQIGDDIIIDTIIPGEFTSVFTQWHPWYTGGRNHYLFAVVDPDNEIAETDEYNNQALKRVWVAGIPDLTGKPERIWTGDIGAPQTPVDGDTINVNAYLFNIGTWPVKGIDYNSIHGKYAYLYRDHPDSGGILVATFTSYIPFAGDSSWLYGAWNTLGCAGENDFYLIIDPTDTLSELREDNNIIHAILHVDPAPQTDIAIRADSILFGQDMVITGDIVTISAHIYTLQNKGADNVVVQFFDGEPQMDVLIHEDTINQIGPLSSTTAQFDFPTDGLVGFHDIYVVVDPYDSIAEKVETNNIAYAELNIRLPMSMIPRNLAAQTVDSTQVELHWQVPDSGAVYGYRVYRNDALVNDPYNCATSGTAFASDYYYMYTPDRAIDGYTSTYWSATNPDSILWWYDSLPFPLDIDLITINWANAPDYFEIHAWENDDWTFIMCDSIPPVYNNITILDVAGVLYTDRIRIYIPNANNFSVISIRECYIYAFDFIYDTTFVDTFWGGGEYTYHVTALDSSVAESPPSNADTVLKEDMTPPGQPLNLQASMITPNRVRLAWDKPADADVWAYRIYRDGVDLLIDTTVAVDVESNPEYKDYDNLQNKDYMFPASVASQWCRKKLLFSRFSTESQHDFLYTEHQYQDKIYDKFTGKHDTLSILQPVNTAHVRFVTDCAGTRSGWAIDSIHYFRDRKYDYYDDYVYVAGTYLYEVTALDSFGNEGVPAVVQVTISDTTKPAAPEGFVIVPGNDQAVLYWRKNSEPDIAGYNVYRTDTTGSLNGTPPWPETTYVDIGLENQEWYTYYVTAVDVNGFESDPSESVSVVISTIDLMVRMEDIFAYPPYPRVNIPVAIQTSVYNLGVDPCDIAQVNYYDGHPDSGGLFIDAETLSIAGGSMSLSQVEWLGPAGTHDIWVCVEPFGYFDVDTINNQAQKELVIYPEDAKIVMFDDAHLPIQTADSTHPTTMWPMQDIEWTGSFSIFAALLVDAGFYTTTLAPGETYNAYTLDDIDVLIIHSPSLDDWTNPPSCPYTAEEIDAVVDWVKDGGGLFLITDHTWYELRLSELAGHFGISWQGLNLNIDETEAVHQGYMYFVGYFDSVHFHDHAVLTGIERLFVNYANVLYTLPSEAIPVVVTDSGMAPDNVPVCAVIQEDPVHANSVTGSGRICVWSDPNSFDNANIDTYAGEENYRIYKGDNEIFAVNVVDWLSEQREDDLPDPALAPLSISIRDSLLVIGRTAPIDITVYNYGPCTVSGLVFAIFQGDPDSGGILLSDTLISLIAEYDSTCFTFQWCPQTGGACDMYFLVDPDEAIIEISEQNNRVVLDLEVVAPSHPDLCVTGVFIDPNPVRHGEMVDITAVVYNYGLTNDGCAADFFLGHPDSGGIYLGSDVVTSQIAPFDSVILTISANIGAWTGVHGVYVVADPNDVVEEENEDNNLHWSLIDIISSPLEVYVSLGDISYEPHTDVAVSACVKNLGLSLWSGDLIVQVEDSSGNIVAIIDTLPLSGLSAAYTDWHFMIPVQVRPAWAPIREGAASVRINFESVLTQLGYENTHLDTNSIRVVEFERYGIIKEEKPSRLYHHADTTSVIVWKLEGYTALETIRYYIIYFDIIENGEKNLPPRILPRDYIMAIDYRNYIYRYASSGNGIFEHLPIIDMLYPWWYTSSPRELVFGDFDNDYCLDIAIPRDNLVESKLYMISSVDTIPGNDTLRLVDDKIYEHKQTDGISGSQLLGSCFMPEQQSDISIHTGEAPVLYPVRAETLPPGITRIGKFWGMQASITYGADHRQMICADFNNDDALDILVGTGGDYAVERNLTWYYIERGYLFLFTNKQNGSFDRVQLQLPGSLSVPATERALYGIDAVDFNKDGNIDIVVLTKPSYNNGSTSVEIAFGNGDGTFSSWIDANIDLIRTVEKINADDFDNDGIVDLILKNDGSYYTFLKFYEGIDDTTFADPVTINLQPEPPYSGGVSWYDHYDYNYDGNLDLIVFPLYYEPGTYYSYKLYYYPGNGDGTFGYGTVLDTLQFPSADYRLFMQRAMPRHSPAASELGQPQVIADSVAFDLTWNTGVTPAGQYYVHVMASEPGGMIAEDTAGFAILPTSQLTVDVLTDKPLYNPQEDVCITNTVMNESENVTYYVLHEKTVIVSPVSDTTVAGERDIDMLGVGEQSIAEYLWQTGINPAGTYQVISVVTDSFSDTLAQASVSFDIEQAVGYEILLTGSIQAIPSIVARPGAFTVEYAVTNKGNFDLDTVILREIIVDGSSLVLEYERFDTVSLAVHDTVMYDSLFSSLSFAYGNHLLGVYAVIGDSNIMIATAGVRIADAASPVITELKPDSCVAGDVLFHAVVFDSGIGVAAVEYHRDTLPYQSFSLVSGDSVYGMYEAMWSTSAQDDGVHWLHVRARDYHTNVSEDSVSFIVDNTIPQIEISGVEHNGYYNQPVTPVIMIIDDNPDTSYAMLNTEPFVSGTTILSEGEYDLYVWAQDCAYNTADTSVFFVIDMTAPDPPLMTVPPESSTVPLSFIDIQGTAEPLARVDLSISAAQFMAYADNFGQFTITDVSLMPGWNLLAFTARDSAENISDTAYYHLECGIGIELEAALYIPDRFGRVLVLSRDGANDIAPILDSLGFWHVIVEDEASFQQEFGTGKYNVLVIHGDRYKLLPRFQKLLFQDVDNGTGLFMTTKGTQQIRKFATVFDIIFGDYISPNLIKRIYFVESPVGDPDTVMITGRVVEYSLDGATLAAEYNTGDPAAVVSEYGDGNTVFFGFDWSDAGAGIETYFAGAVVYATPESTEVEAGGLIPVELSILNLTSERQLNAVEVIPGDFVIVAAMDSGEISGQSITWNCALPQDSVVKLTSVIELPNQPCTDTVLAEITYLEGGQYLMYDTVYLEVSTIKDDMDPGNVLDLIIETFDHDAQDHMPRDTVFVLLQRLREARNILERDPAQSAEHLIEVCDRLISIPDLAEIRRQLYRITKALLMTQSTYRDREGK
jgi:subtilase family serine protease/fibronectin type 3 domain-containing protein